MDHKSNTTSSDGPGALKRLPDLTSLRAVVSNGALKGDKLPERIKVFAWGDNPSTKGTFKVGDQTVAVLGANQKALGFERVAIDYNHCTVEGSPEYVKGQPKAIFGYGTVKAIPGDGVFLEGIEWTPLGVANARNYEDLSPAAHADKEVDFIHSVALTPNGCLYDVTFFSAGGSGADAKGPKEKKVMDIKTENSGITLALLAGALGLAAEAAEADVVNEIKSLSALKRLSALDPLIKDGKVLVLDTVVAMDTRLKAIETASTRNVALLSATVDGKVVNFTGEDVVKLSARLDLLQTTIERQATELQEGERGRLVTLFAAEGKVPKDGDGKPYTAEALKKLDMGTLKLLHANTPSTVPLSARGVNAREGGGIDPNLKGRERFIAAQERENARSQRN